MNSKKGRTIYMILFIILYVFVALVSGIHGFHFFGLANTPLLAVMLALAFEIGQAAVLFSILTDRSQQKRIMPWILMIILTLVQVMGNVYNSFKYLIQNAGDNLRFFKEPIFIWTQLPDAEANVILSYIQGAILPIVALMLTAMVSNFLRDNETPEEVEYIEEEIPADGDEYKNIPEDEPSEDALKKFEEIKQEREEEDTGSDGPDKKFLEDKKEGEAEHKDDDEEEHKDDAEKKEETPQKSGFINI